MCVWLLLLLSTNSFSSFSSSFPVTCVRSFIHISRLFYYFFCSILHHSSVHTFRAASLSFNYTCVVVVSVLCCLRVSIFLFSPVTNTDVLFESLFSSPKMCCFFRMFLLFYNFTFYPKMFFTF